MKAFAWLLGLAVLLPFPAFPVARSVGIQFGHVLVLLLLPALLFLGRIRLKDFYFSLLLIVPALMSLLMTGIRDVDLNATVMLCLALLTVPVCAALVRASRGTFICGILVGLSVQGVFAIAQQLSFLVGEFPFQFLYVNPSFADLQGTGVLDQVARWTRRSFGLMPEPSAMLASLSPWLVVLCGALLSRQNVLETSGEQIPIGLLVVGVALGFLACALSRSGGNVYLAVAVVLIATVQHVSGGKRSVSNEALKLIGFGGVVLLAGYLYDVFVVKLSAEMSTGTSWSDRYESLAFALRLSAMADFLQSLFGYGMGRVGFLAENSTRLPAIQSFILTFWIGTGLVGLFGFGLAFWQAWQAIGKGASRHVFRIGVGMWFVCLLTLTAYNQLLAIWAFIGFVLGAPEGSRISRYEASGRSSNVIKTELISGDNR